MRCLHGITLFYILVHGGYSQWSEFSICTTTCGGGIQERRRNCTNPVPKYMGKDCSGLGENVESRTCSLENCPGSRFDAYFYNT